jgi:hypothetical protein
MHVFIWDNIRILKILSLNTVILILRNQSNIRFPNASILKILGNRKNFFKFVNMYRVPLCNCFQKSVRREETKNSVTYRITDSKEELSNFVLKCIFLDILITSIQIHICGTNTDDTRPDL